MKLILAISMMLSAFWPTSLDLMLDGVPLASKPELFGVFAFILIGCLGLLQWIAQSDDSAVRSRAFRGTAWIAFSLSLLLLLIKLQFPPTNENSVTVCQRSPFKGDGQCLTSVEPLTRKPKWGEALDGTPWRLFFLNTLDFNHYACAKTDLNCFFHVEARAKQSEPFEIEIAVPPAWRRDQSEIAIRFAGMIRKEGEPWGEYRKALSRAVSASNPNQETRFWYRNFHCAEADIRKCNRPESFESLNVREAAFAVEVSQPALPWVGGLRWLERALVGFLMIWILALLWDASRAITVLRHEEIEPRWIKLVNAVLIISYLAFLSSKERGYPEILVGVILWMLMWNGSFNRVLPTIFTRNLAVLSFCWWMLHSWYWLPAQDVQLLYPVGIDELSYSNIGYEFLTHPSLLVNMAMSLSKPFFGYVRALEQWLFGDGTLYWKATTSFFLGLIPALLCLVTAPLISTQESRQGRPVSCVFVFVSTLIFFTTLSLFRTYILVFESGNSEIPAWGAGFLALLGVIAVLPKANVSTTRWMVIWGLCAFSIGMRTFNVVVFLLLPLFYVLHAEGKKRAVATFVGVMGMAGLGILLHALPLFTREGTEGFQTYLGWQFNGWNNERPSIWWGFDRIFFHMFSKLFLIFFIVLGIIRCRYVEHGKYYLAAFLALSFAVVVAHSKIADPAGYPRHVLFFGVTVSFFALASLLYKPPVNELPKFLNFLKEN